MDGACPRCRNAIEHEIPHGTSAGYRYHGCRCGKCRDWNAIKECARRRAKGIPPATAFQCGTPGLYRRGCRCDLCMEARRDERERYRGGTVRHHGFAGWCRGCRCDKCREANRTHCRHDREKNRAIRAASKRVDYENNRGYYLESRRRRTARERAALPRDRNGQRWTVAEDVIIQRNDLTVREMSYMIRRSPDTIRYRRSKLKR